MVVYQKFGVIGTTLVFAVLQKLKFQLFRLFIVYDTCRRTNTCDNSTDLLNTTDIYFQDENVSDYIFKCLIVNNTVSIFPCIFLAAWSDKHGRKVLLSLPFVGSIIGDILMLVLLYVPIASKNMLLLSEAVHGFCGGTVLIGLGCLCYLTDSTDHRLRTWFIGLLLGMINFLPVIEMAFQYFFNPIKISLDFRTLILIGISIRMFLTVYFLIYIKIFVVESVFVLGSYQGNPWANLLTPINVSDTVNCVFKRRLDNMRFFIIALCTVFIFYSFVLYGNITVWTQHFWKFFHMSLKNVMIFSGAQIICSLLIPTSILSVLSKLIERNETGSMYAGIGFLMLVSQLMSIPSYRALYEICTEGIPQVTFLLSFGFATFGMLFFIYLKKLIAPDLLGHLNASESLALISRKTEFEQLFQ
ncbi:hypothetical protein HNY73_005791 [Argiope bruennichi]|uniref:Uncharacterized protein n=1 Tax=Argiope bruennichi TaxID=94029 RepID=A0A8T0FIM0_ARGBR|nr:hypothetical protein HNY73_005791 [Argiope bruennichi]